VFGLEVVGEWKSEESVEKVKVFGLGDVRMNV